MKSWLYKYYRKFRRKAIRLSKRKFERRILRRWEVFWRDANDLELMDVKFKSSDSLDKWRKIQNWQRRLSNKHNAKEFATKMGCRVAKKYWQGGQESFSKLDIELLPNNYIIKPIFGFATKNVYLMRNGFNLFNSQHYSSQELKNEILHLFSSNPGMEILIEEFLSNEDGQYKVPNDYRFYTANGKIIFIQLDKRRGLKKDQVSFYTEDWELINKKILIDATTDKTDPAPNCLGEMITLVTRLSKTYENFVRIDFYSTDKGAVFGEFTPTPRKGRHVTRYGNKLLIKAWDQNCKGLI